MDTTGPAAFGSPQAGPLGRVIEGTPWLSARPLRQPPTRPDHLDARVDIVTAYLGADGRALEEASRACDGLVAVLLGAGHSPPAFMPALARATTALPVVITTRVARGGLLHDTYGFPGAERDVRATGAVAAGLLSPAAARMKLQACLGAGLDLAGIAAAFAGDDASPGRTGATSPARPSDQARSPDPESGPRFRRDRSLGSVACPHPASRSRRVQPPRCSVFRTSSR